MTNENTKEALLFLFDVVQRMALGIELTDDDYRKLSDPCWHFDLNDDTDFGCVICVKGERT